jgi:hypothetical protein
VIWARIVVCSVMGCLTLALSGARAEPAVAEAWSIQLTPNPASATYSVLSGVSCASPRVCTAVGYFTNSDGVGAALAERWNGIRWTIQQIPNPTGSTSTLLFGVACASKTACTAVGSVSNRTGTTAPLAERWNGIRWTIERIPNPAKANSSDLSYLSDVSCASTTACIAVGYSGNRPGTAGVTLVERWNGTSWGIQRTPYPVDARAAFLSGVSCAGLASCTAAGFFINDAGAGVTLAEYWNGTIWSIQRTANPVGATYVQLVGVSCASATSCTTVGFFTDVTGIEVMIAERSNATTWGLERTLYPDSARYVQFTGVSCASSSSCTAVGFLNNVTGFDVTLAERRNGTAWVIQPTPNPVGATNNSLGAVSCPSKTACIAVGGFTNSAGTGMTLAERYS